MLEKVAFEIDVAKISKKDMERCAANLLRLAERAFKNPEIQKAYAQWEAEERAKEGLNKKGDGVNG